MRSFFLRLSVEFSNFGQTVLQVRSIIRRTIGARGVVGPRRDAPGPRAQDGVRGVPHGRAAPRGPRAQLSGEDTEKSQKS